jgi:hypothetical protein
MKFIEKCLINLSEIDKFNDYIKKLKKNNIEEKNYYIELGFSFFEWNIISRDKENYKNNIIDLIENRKFLEPRNQFLDLNNLILEIADESKNKAAYLKIAIPSILAKKLLKQMSLKKSDPIRGLRLSYLDLELKEN